MASKGVNKVIILGNLGKDPEVRYLPNGTAACNFSVATSESWKDKNTGEQKEKTEWHNISILGKLAEIAGQYLKKGSKVYLEGKLQTRKWQDQSGNDRYSTEICLNDFSAVMQMLDPPSGINGAQQEQQQQGYQQQAPQQQQQAPQQQPQQQLQGNYQQQQAPAQQQQGGYAAPQQQAVINNGFDDDIPF